MNWAEISGNFQRSFPGGRFREHRYLGGNVVQVENLQMDDMDTHPVIPLATVVYNQDGQTWVIEEPSGKTHYVTPLSPAEYLDWKEGRHEGK